MAPARVVEYGAGCHRVGVVPKRGAGAAHHDLTDLTVRQQGSVLVHDSEVHVGERPAHGLVAMGGGVSVSGDHRRDADIGRAVGAHHRAAEPLLGGLGGPRVQIRTAGLDHA